MARPPRERIDMRVAELVGRLQRQLPHRQYGPPAKDYETGLARRADNATDGARHGPQEHSRWYDHTAFARGPGEKYPTAELRVLRYTEDRAETALREQAVRAEGHERLLEGRQPFVIPLRQEYLHGMPPAMRDAYHGPPTYQQAYDGPRNPQQPRALPQNVTPFRRPCRGPSRNPVPLRPAA